MVYFQGRPKFSSQAPATSAAGSTSQQLGHNPIALSCNWEGMLLPVLRQLEAYFEPFGPWWSPKLLVAGAVAKAPALLIQKAAKLQDNLEYMQQLGLSSREISELAWQQPQLLCWNFLGDTIQKKLHYCEAILRKSPKDMLGEAASCLKSSLAWMDYKARG
jgi:hypothetical protein